MHPVVPQAVATFLISGALAVQLLSRRGKASLHWHFLALLLALMVWSGGAAWRYTARGGTELHAAFSLMFLGAYLIPPLWLLLAARFARVQHLEGRPGRVAALLAPAFGFWLAFVTNARHGWMAVEVGFDVFRYGPLFWVALGFSYFCVAAGVALFLHRARWLVARKERRRAALLALVALVPVAANACYVLGWVPFAHDPTPLSLGLSATLLSALVFRFRLLENLPLVRSDVLAHLRDGVLIADPSGLLVDANPAAEALLGAGCDALRGTSLATALAAIARPDDAERLDMLLSPAPGCALGAPRADAMATRAGRWLDIHAAEVRGRSGDPAGRYVVLRDVTEARRYEGVVRRSQRLESVGLLASGIAHEVNNPLAFVQANLMHLQGVAERLSASAGERCEKPDADLEEMPRVLEETLEGVDRIARIVASLRRLTRAEDAIPLDQRVDLNEVVAEAAKLAGLHRTPDVQLRTALDPELPPVRGSQDRLIQALLNLLLNAKQALAAAGGGHVVAETLRVGGAVEVRVSDDGPGIDDALQALIFDPFFTTKGPDEGTGLGLPIAWDIVREHGGWMELSSRPGGGASFAIRLPLAPTP